jgi:hypothetical protein
MAFPPLGSPSSHSSVLITAGSGVSSSISATRVPPICWLVWWFKTLLLRQFDCWLLGALARRLRTETRWSKTA